MLTIRELSASGIPVLGTYKLRLDKYPLMVIRGNNLDRKNTKGSSNGSGKTLCVSPIPTLVYETTANSLKKKASKDLLTTKNSFIQMTMNDGKERIIRKELTTSVKHFITTNKVVSSYRKPEEAKAEIRKIFPLSEEAFNTQLFIDGRQKTILQSGTATQRFAYLETIFQLNEYDRLNALVNKDYTYTKRLIQELGVLITEKKERKSALPAMDNIKLSKKQKEIEADIEKFTARVEKYIELHNNTKTYLSLVEDLDTTQSVSSLEASFEEAQAELVTMTKLYKKSVRHYEALEQQEALRGRRQKLQEGIKSILGNIELLPEINSKVERLKNKRDNAATDVEEALANNKVHNATKTKLEALETQVLLEKYKDKTIEELEQLRAKTQAIRAEKLQSRRNLKDYLKHDHEDQNCPVCQRGLSKKTAQFVIESLDTNVSKLIRKEETLTHHIKIKTYLNTIEEYAYVDIEPLEANYQKYVRLIKKYETQADALERKSNLITRLADLPKSDAIEDTTIPKPFVYQTTLEDLNKRIAHIEYSISTHKRIQRLGYTLKPKKDVLILQNSYKEKLNTYRPSLQNLQKELSVIVAKESVYSSILEDVNRLATKIDDLKLETKDFKILESLKKAFGPKGLRKIKTRSYVSKLQHSFNKYASFIFGENITFKFQLTDNQFDILYEMNGVIKDVRRLSGSESSCFTLLLILCILPFIPSNLRTNLVVLDELEIGMDSGTRRKFVEDFLPILQKVVPNVVLITPMSEQEFYVPNAKTLLITKQNGKSTLKML